MNQPAHTWITRAPFVWLPAVMVTLALFGHILVFAGYVPLLPSARSANVCLGVL